MTDKCPFMEDCVIFEHFYSDNIRDVFVAAYCEGRYEGCVRKKMRDRGEKVPEMLLPTGKLLQKQKSIFRS